MGTTPPGRSATATVKLPAGRYAIIDTEGSDEGPPSTLGAKAAFEVTGDGDGEIKETSAKVVAKDEGNERHVFEASGLKAGTNSLTFDNTSKEIHQVIAFPIRGNAKLADVKKLLETEGRPYGPPPVDFREGMQHRDPRRQAEGDHPVQAAEGRSVLLCFLTDPDGKGKSHFADGMLEEVDVR